MTLATLYPPIAAATILNVFLFALAWKGSQVERRERKTPWHLEIGLVSYIALIGLIIYLTLHRPLASGLDLFMAALIGEAFGVLLVYAILHVVIFSRGQPKADRAFSIVATLFLTGLVIAGTFFG